MIDSYIKQYIEKLSVNHTVNEMLLAPENIFIDKIFRIKPNKVFAPKFTIAFSGCNQVDFMELLDELEKVNKLQNNDKPIPCILFVPSSMHPENLTFFNGIVFVHLAIFDKENNQVLYDKDVHYFGVKSI